MCDLHSYSVDRWVPFPLSASCCGPHCTGSELLGANVCMYRMDGLVVFVARKIVLLSRFASRGVVIVLPHLRLEEGLIMCKRE